MTGCPITNIPTSKLAAAKELSADDAQRGQDRRQRLPRNAALSAFQPPHIGTVRTPLRKSLVCAPGNLGIRSA